MPPAQPRALILDIYGAYARRQGNWFAVAHLVSLLADLGVDEAAVRSAVSRMKRRGLLAHSRQHGLTGYALTDTALAVLAEGDARIFSNAEPASVDDPWTLAVFSVPERERARRHVLRSQLSRLGFGTLAPGAWIAPGRLLPETEAVLRRHGLTGYIDLFEGRYRNFSAAREMVERAWDLDALASRYKRFLAGAEPVLHRWRRRQGSDRDAFVDYVSVLDQWRRLPFLDPGLPDEVLPAGWEGTRARGLFLELVDRVDPAAYRHVTHAGH